MNIQDIMTAITTVGFPIVACAACFWYINKSGIEHKDEIDKLSTALNNNTVVMQRLVDKLGGDSNVVQ